MKSKISNIIVVAVMAALCPVMSLAQIRTNIPNKATQLNIERVAIQPTSKAKSGSGKKDAQVKEPEYALYRNLVRKNSWLVGQGEPITQEVANHLPYYFRLSMKNDKGHYQFVEALHGESLTTAHPLSPYILDKTHEDITDSEETREWRRKISTVGQWLLTSDLSGENMIEERAYEAVDKNANLIYVFQPVMIDSIHAICTYLNDWGLPVDIQEGDDHYYGSVVQITYGVNGNDSIVDFIDGKGLRRYNEYLVDQIQYTFDNKDRMTSMTNHNVVGRLMNDVSSYSGKSIKYDDKTGDYTVSFFDRGKNPVKQFIPLADVRSNEIRVSLDNWGRESQIDLLDAPSLYEGVPVNRIRIEYDNKGNITNIVRELAGDIENE